MQGGEVGQAPGEEVWNLAAKSVHTQFMGMVTDLLEGRLDISNFEDNCRALLGGCRWGGVGGWGGGLGVSTHRMSLSCKQLLLLGVEPGLHVGCCSGVAWLGGVPGLRISGWAVLGYEMVLAESLVDWAAATSAAQKQVHCGAGWEDVGPQ